MPVGRRHPEPGSTYDWLIFTSVNGVKYFFERLFALGKDVRALHHVRTAVIGPATAERLRQQGLRSDIVPASYRAEAVIDAFATEKIAGQRILIPRAAEARPILPDELRRMGATVDEIATYHTRPVTDGASDLVADLENGRVDMVTFTSSSTVKHFHADAARRPTGPTDGQGAYGQHRPHYHRNRRGPGI
jgi:uroporphyrinogen III methyltransferase/synthase